MKLFDVGFVSFTLLDLIDVSVVAFLIYRLHKTLRKSAAISAVYLLFGVFLIWRLVDLLNMVLLRTILQEFLQIGAVAFVVIFAPELRRLVLNMSRNTMFDRFRKELAGQLEEDQHFEEIISACETMANARTGALIVLIRQSDLNAIVETGDLLNAAVSKRLLISIFNTKSPLHDGAVMVKGGQIIAARCVLPVSDDPDIPPELGLRHRSALGLSEISDAIAIVVSEESGHVSIAYAGRIKRNLSSEEMRQFLRSHFVHPDAME